MKNPATHRPTCDEFNEFTQWLREAILSGKWKPVVRLRNGMCVELTWFDGDGPEYEYFASDISGRMLAWNNDGTSVTSADYDMMETM